MTDLATLVLAVDSSQVPKGTAALNELTAAGARAEAAAGGLGGGLRGAGAEASAMAAAAQASARSVMDQAAGFTSATQAARINTMAMRESLVVARELSRGNFTRIPGSLTLLAQGIGSQGGIGAFAQSLGLIKQLQDAELAEAAAGARAAAEGVEGAARRAAANVMAADTELALAEAQLRVTEGTSAESASQLRLAEAHDAVAAAAREAGIAEDALGVAMARSAEASAASGAAATTEVTALGAALGGAVVVGGLAAAVFASVKDAADQLDPSAYQFMGTLGLTQRELQKLTDVGVTWGDTMSGTFDALEKAAGISASQFSSYWREALLEIAQVGVSAAQVIAASFAAAAKIANETKMVGVAAVTGQWSLAAGTKNPADIGKDALASFKKTFEDTGKFFHEDLPKAANAERDMRLQAQADKIIANRPDARARHPRQPGDHGIGEELATLNAQIKGQNALADAYGVSEAAAMKAIADQKAQEQAIRHHADAAQLAALAEKELALAVAQDSAQAAKHVRDLTVETAARKTVNDLIAAGLIPASQANQQLQVEMSLRTLNADKEAELAAIQAAHAQHRLADEAQWQAALQRTLCLIHDTKTVTKQANDELARGQAIEDSAGLSNEIQKLTLENSLIGASNRERATAIAQLEEMQKLGVTDLSTATVEQQRAIQSAGQRAWASVQTPWQQWSSSVPQTADAINQALQSIETRGFDNLSQAIAGVVTGTESLGKAFKDVASSIISDIIQMTVKMLIFRAISSFMGNTGSFGGGSDAGLFGGGASGLGDTYSVGGLATGGPVMAGQTYLVGEKGPELFKASTSGTIIPNDKLAAFPSKTAANSNSPQEVHVTIGFGDAPAFAPYVQEVAGAAAGQAVRISVDHTNKSVKALVRPKLMGR